MERRVIRVRVEAGNLVPLEPIELPDGTEFDVAFEAPMATVGLRARPKLVLPEWNLGVIEPLTREAFYDESD